MSHFSSCFFFKSPAIVPDVEAFAISSTSVLVSWTRLGTPNVTQYMVLYRLEDSSHRGTEEDLSTSTATNSSAMGVLRVSASKTTVVIDGLLKNATYQVLVAAEAVVDHTLQTGPLSDPVTVVTTFPRVIVIPEESVATEIVQVTRNNPTYGETSC